MTLPRSIDSDELSRRRAQLLPALADIQVEAFLTTEPSNVRYLTGFTGSNGALLLTSDRALLFTDPRYAIQAPLESDCEVQVVKGALLPQIITWTGRLRLDSLAIEQNRISFHEFSVLQNGAPKLPLHPTDGLVEGLRMVKSLSEIDTIRQSVLLNSKALAQALKHFKPTRATEIDLAAEIEFRMRRLGAESTAFDTIVATGSRTALPHAHPTTQPVQADQLLLVDMGARVAGYCSDMTRTFAVGKLNPKARRMYKAVLESQLAAIDAVKSGATTSAVDRAARRVLASYGLEKAFVHSTGHGLGLEIHENPRVGRKAKAGPRKSGLRNSGSKRPGAQKANDGNDTKLSTGMVITIEPGVYLEGMGGVRIEDTVVVTQTGCEILTPTSKELITL